MEGTLSPGEKQVMISSFLEIAVGQSADTATQFLQATGWKLDDAIQLFYVGNEGGIAAPGSPSMAMENSSAWTDENVGARNDFGNANFGQGGLEEVRAPLPVVRDTLYDDAVLYGPPRAGNLPHEPSAMVAFRNFDEEMKQPAVWESEKGATSGGDNPRDNLASLYRPPFHLMFNGSFDKAKSAASVEDKWLLVNLQSTKEFSSHMLNRDTWANEAVAQTISTNFIFWQVYDDTSEGRKVCTYYKLDSIPVVLVIDPITGQKMRSWIGMVQPENLLEDILSFMDGGPRDYHKNLSHKRPRGNSALPEKNIQPVDDTPTTSENSKKDSTAVSSDNKSTTSAGEAEVEEAAPAKKVVYPPLPEEPKTDRSLLCRVGVRLPDGRRFQRNFLKTDPIQLLWSFCSSLLEDGEIRPFRLTQAIPGAKSLDFDSKLSFQESGLANSMVSVAWE